MPRAAPRRPAAPSPGQACTPGRTAFRREPKIVPERAGWAGPPPTHPQPAPGDGKLGSVLVANHGVDAIGLPKVQTGEHQERQNKSHGCCGEPQIRQNHQHGVCDHLVVVAEAQHLVLHPGDDVKIHRAMGHAHPEQGHHPDPGCVFIGADLPADDATQQQLNQREKEKHPTEVGCFRVVSVRTQGSGCLKLAF